MQVAQAHAPADRPQLQSLVATVAQDARALGQVDDPQVAAPANPSGATPSIQSVPSSAADAPLAPPLGSQVSILKTGELGCEH